MWQYPKFDLTLLLQFCLRISKMYVWVLYLQRQESYEVFNFQKLDFFIENWKLFNFSEIDRWIFLKFCGMIPDLVSSQLPHTECIELIVALLSSFWATVWRLWFEALLSYQGKLLNLLTTTYSWGQTDMPYIHQVQSNSFKMFKVSFWLKVNTVKLFSVWQKKCDILVLIWKFLIALNSNFVGQIEKCSGPTSWTTPPLSATCTNRDRINRLTLSVNTFSRPSSLQLEPSLTLDLFPNLRCSDPLQK